ncbi:sensor histidine kinase [Streptomyces sp. SID3343]|uniref:sensor histidine kinase n=1 Tax=Streptomyces sp. SID3343 TaxID=2690260 RepID=UPI00136F22E1|nr:sensor histidine kinase [Streptomyces sp. SID3343]MYV99508.1 sensor histidine kinase [Streptomyces sp. SID3343]
MRTDHPRATAPGGLLVRLAARGAAPRRPARLSWNLNDALIVAATGLADVLGYIVLSRANGPSTSTTGVVLLTLSALLLFVRRRYPVQVLAAVLVMQVGFTFREAGPHMFATSTAVALYAVSRSRGRLAVALGAGATLAAQLLRDERGTDPLAWAGLADVMTTGLVVATGAGVFAWRQQQSINRQLLADGAVIEERRRIARELHDIVAHHITTMYLMSGGARSTLDRDPETARSALITLEGSGRTALREMRQLLGVLRSSDAPEEAPSAPQPGMAQLDGLIAESCAAGLPTELEVAGPARPLPLATGLTVYRIVQEALTNARKHAGHARARVRVEYLPDRVVIEVCDDGTGIGERRAPAVAGAGYGLLGMRERVAVHGGTLETGGRDEGGYRVAATVPIPPTQDEEKWPR